MGGRTDLFGFFGTSFTAKRWLSLDTCGCFGVSLSWTVHLYALIVIAWHLISGSFLLTALYLLVYVPTALLAMVSLFMAWTTDPGAVPLGARPLVTVRRANSTASNNSTSSTTDQLNTNGVSSTISAGTPSLPLPPSTTTNLTSPSPSTRRAVRRCHKCHDNFKPARAHHDSVTGRCVVKFDHFCPWVGNAVGAKNHKFFCLFLLYTAATCLLSLLFLVVRVIRCGYVTGGSDDDNNNNNKDGNVNDNRFLGESRYVYQECNNFYGNHVITALALASLIFLIFSCSMGCEQLDAIASGKSKIARMKMRVGSNDTEFTRVTEEFNEMFGGDSPDPEWHWFWPSAVVYPRGMEKVVLGYEWDPSFDAAPFRQNDSESASSLSMSSSLAAGADELELGDMEGGLLTPRGAALAAAAELTMSVAQLSSDNGNGLGRGAAGESDGIMMTRVNGNSHTPLKKSSSSSDAKQGIKNRRLNRASSGGGVADDGSSLMDRTQSQLT
jgi:hypothetical protein